VADELIGKEVSNKPIVVHDLSKSNTFLQNWEPRQRRYKILPKELQQMLKVAKQYKVKLDAPEINKSLKEKMPIWHYKGFNPVAKVLNNSVWADCQRINHQILTVGKMCYYMCSDPPADHQETSLCVCHLCARMQYEGCTNPHKC